MTVKCMGKSLLSVLLCLGIIFCLGTAIFAVDDTPDDGTDGAVTDPLPSEDDPAEGDPSESEPVEPEQPDPPVVNELDSCICGRPYYTADGDKHYKYDCIGCGFAQLNENPLFPKSSTAKRGDFEGFLF